MNFFGERRSREIIGTRRRFDAGESQPVPAADCFHRLHNHITDAGVQMESDKNPFGHSSFDGIASAAVWRRGRIHDRRPMANWNQSLKGMSRRSLPAGAHGFLEQAPLALDD